ncbi:unnamed protein product [Acanthosepion pharaonis]|uniref:Uncharacterized protein n=1 Tax=Acanthosepion pharaonis TaxID=158019 RepID=A0A812DXZ6_ACAPH|nr:unnamed protein product [Sepia pharaonis]
MPQSKTLRRKVTLCEFQFCLIFISSLFPFLSFFLSLILSFFADVYLFLFMASFHHSFCIHRSLQREGKKGFTSYKSLKSHQNKPIYLSIYLSIYLFIKKLEKPSNKPIYLSIYLSIYRRLFICVYVFRASILLSAPAYKRQPIWEFSKRSNRGYNKYFLGSVKSVILTLYKYQPIYLFRPPLTPYLSLLLLADALSRIFPDLRLSFTHRFLYHLFSSAFAGRFFLIPQKIYASS